MNIVGTPCNAVQRSCATALQSVQRTEMRRGQNHRRAVRHAGEVSQHHAEAVIERHGDAQPVAMR